MLSTKYENVIHKFLDEKENAYKYDKSRAANNYEMVFAYSDIFQNLRDLSQNNTLGDEQCKYANDISNGILDSNVWNNGKTQIKDYHINQLRQLDYMKDNNKNIINTCLDAIDPNYLFDSNFFDKISILKTGIIMSHSEAAYIWEFNVLKIHFNVLLCRIYFVWKSNIQLYLPDMIKYIDLAKKMNQSLNLNPYSSYPEFRSAMYNIFSAKKEHAHELFQYMELLVKNYKTVNIMPDILNPSSVMSLSPSEIIIKIKKMIQKEGTDNIMINLFNDTKKQIESKMEFKNCNDVLFEKEMIGILHTKYKNQHPEVMKKVIFEMDTFANAFLASGLNKKTLIGLDRTQTIHRFDETYKSIEKFAVMIREYINTGTQILIDNITGPVTDAIVNIMTTKFNNSIKITPSTMCYGISSISSISQKIDAVIHIELLKYLRENNIDFGSNVYEAVILLLDQNWHLLVQNKLNTMGRNVQCRKNCKNTCTKDCESSYFSLHVTHLFDSMLNDETFETIKTMLSKQKEATKIIVKKKNTEKKSKEKNKDEGDKKKKSKKKDKDSNASKKGNKKKSEKEEVEIKINIPKNVLDNLKIQGLKELCLKNKVVTTKCKIRKDYVDLLLPYVEP